MSKQDVLNTTRCRIINYLGMVTFNTGATTSSIINALSKLHIDYTYMDDAIRISIIDEAINSLLNEGYLFKHRTARHAPASLRIAEGKLHACARLGHILELLSIEPTTRMSFGDIVDSFIELHGREYNTSISHVDIGKSIEEGLQQLVEDNRLMEIFNRGVDESLTKYYHLLPEETTDLELEVFRILDQVCVSEPGRSIAQLVIEIAQGPNRDKFDAAAECFADKVELAVNNLLYICALVEITRKGDGCDCITYAVYRKHMTPQTYDVECECSTGNTEPRYVLRLVEDEDDDDYMESLTGKEMLHMLAKELGYDVPVKYAQRKRTVADDLKDEADAAMFEASGI